MSESLKKKTDNNMGKFQLLAVWIQFVTEKTLKSLMEEKLKKSGTWRERSFFRCSSLVTVDMICQKTNLFVEAKVCFIIFPADAIC